MEYKDHTEQLKATSNINPTDIFDYENSTYKNIFQSAFKALIGDLVYYSKQFRVEPTYLFFRNTFEINAGALNRNNCSLIYISNAFVVKLYDKLVKDRKFIEESSLHEYINIQNKHPHNLNYLMFQCSIIFTFYHEFAHVVQQKKNDYNFNENILNTKFDFERHILEYDADLNGCQFVSVYIQEFFKNLSKDLKNNENFKLLIYLGISSIIITFILFLTNGFKDKYDKKLEEFYTEQNTHPHTYVRINYIIKHYIHVARINKVDLNQEDTLKEVSKIIREYFKGTDIFENFANEFSKHIMLINEYEMKLSLASRNKKNLVKYNFELFGFKKLN